MGTVLLINDHLSDDAYLDASDIEVSVENCDVILSGTVDSRQAKCHAENLLKLSLVSKT